MGSDAGISDSSGKTGQLQLDYEAQYWLSFIQQFCFLLLYKINIIVPQEY